MEKAMTRAAETEKTYKAVIYTSRFFAELNPFAVAVKISPAFPQYSNRGRDSNRGSWLYLPTAPKRWSEAS